MGERERNAPSVIVETKARVMSSAECVATIVTRAWTARFQSLRHSQLTIIAMSEILY